MKTNITFPKGTSKSEKKRILNQYRKPPIPSNHLSETKSEMKLKQIRKEKQRTDNFRSLSF